MFAKRSMFVGRTKARSRRGPVVLGGLALAGAAALLASGHGPWASPKASIGGAPLEAPPQSASEVAAFVNLADKTKIPAQQKPGAAAAVAGALPDLDKIVRQGDQYVTTLTDGRRAVLTLDARLQTYAEKLLTDARAPRGAIVAMTPDGKILALAGRRRDADQPPAKAVFDWRVATEVWAPSASVFKLVTASALLRAGVGADDKVCYHGGIRSVVEHNLRDDKRDRRCESLAFGVAHSQNAILGKLAFQKLVPGTLEAEAKLLGWNSPVAGDLAATAGELAIPQAQDLQFARTAAGFTGTKLSVIGGAVLAATFAAEGEQPAARLIASIDGVPVPALPRRRAIDAEFARSVARMMVGTCASGSAARVFGGRRNVAGKTGTLTHSAPSHIEHSWFVGFAPAEKPEIVVAVLLGNELLWHIRGHEAAKRLIERALAPATEREKDR